MPSALEQTLIKTSIADIIQSSGMRALITSPPLMRVAYELDHVTASDMEVIPAEANKAYIIHGYYVNAGNTAAEACTAVSISATDYFTGKPFVLDGFGLTANAANQSNTKGNGINVLTLPGKSVNVAVDAAPNWRQATVYYTVVDC